MVNKKTAVKIEAVKISSAKMSHFNISAFEAKAVYLAGDFNNWDTQANPLKLKKNGIWETAIKLKPGRYEYRFLVDDAWENGASCSDCVPNAFGSMNNVIIIE